MGPESRPLPWEAHAKQSYQRLIQSGKIFIVLKLTKTSFSCNLIDCQEEFSSDFSSMAWSFSLCIGQLCQICTWEFQFAALWNRFLTTKVICISPCWAEHLLHVGPRMRALFVICIVIIYQWFANCWSRPRSWVTQQLKIYFDFTYLIRGFKIFTARRNFKIWSISIMGGLHYLGTECCELS